MNFVYEQIVSARSKMADHDFVSADKQLASLQNYAEENAVVVKPTLSDGADEGLKSCPYCGGSNLTEFNGRIECEGCGAHGPDEQRGICWNDRDFA